MGPTLPISREIFTMKYAMPGETFEGAVNRVTKELAENPAHQRLLFDIVANQRFLFGGRIMAAIGSGRNVTAMNCFVSGKIEDSFDDIYDKLKEAGQTMRMGGGIGYDFSTLRPKGTEISSLGSQASGPISFMGPFDATCKTIASAGHRRGAQMGVLRIDHPDIREFISAKRNSTALTNFNISIAVTDKFMAALNAGSDFDLTFNERVYDSVNAESLWNEVMQSTWDWAEPGIIFIDRVNQWNNLWYCEDIATTNPCAEQPLPPYASCLLGSLNLTKYVTPYGWNYLQLRKDIPAIVSAMDRVIDISLYPLEKQRQDHKSKRRMGIGVTGLANAIESMGYLYGTKEFLNEEAKILCEINHGCYEASMVLAIIRGPFALFDAPRYGSSRFIATLEPELQKAIEKNGIRNSHLTSIAPTGTISLTADNVSSGIEPTFSRAYDRTIQTFEGPRIESVKDWAHANGHVVRTADECSVRDHLNVAAVAQTFVDSAISKTCNVGAEVTFDQFKNIYMDAYDMGLKGCTTFRASGKRFGILNVKEDAGDVEGAACFIDPETGKKTCD